MLTTNCYLLPTIILRDYRLCGIDRGDITFVEQYTVAKPVPVPLEFTDLVGIIMQENNATVPQTIADSLALYIELVNSVEEWNLEARDGLWWCKCKMRFVLLQQSVYIVDKCRHA